MSECWINDDIEVDQFFHLCRLHNGSHSSDPLQVNETGSSRALLIGSVWQQPSVLPCCHCQCLLKGCVSTHHRMA